MGEKGEREVKAGEKKVGGKGRGYGRIGRYDKEREQQSVTSHFLGGGISPKFPSAS